MAPAISWPRLGGTEMRQSGRVRTASEAKGLTLRILRHRSRDFLSSRTLTAPKLFICAARVSLRWATEGEKPSRRRTVEAADSGTFSNQGAIWSGKCAAPETSHA